MKHLLTTALILTLATPLYAGGPIIVEETTETAAEHDRKVPAIVWMILGAAVVAVLAGNSGDNCNGEETPPTSGGC